MDWISRLITDICELSDRSSPKDYPDHMLVTGKELRDLIDRRLEVDCLSVVKTPLHPK